MTDGSKPLDGFREEFALHVLGGDKPIDAYRKIYPKAKQGTCEVESSRLRNEPQVDLRITWLRSQVASKKILTATRKREILHDLAEDDGERAQDRIAAIKVDNDMSGDNAPVKQSHEVVVESREDWLRRIRGRQDDAPDA